MTGRFRTWVRIRAWRWQTIAGIGVLLMGISTLLNVALSAADEDNEHANDQIHRQLIAHLQAELQCRSEIGFEASNLEGEIGRETALGLVDVARGDQEALLRRADTIEQLATELEPALARRAEAVEHCAPDQAEP